MAYPEPTSPGGMSSRRLTNRNTNRYSVTALFSMAAEQDVEVEDELARAQKRLRDLKGKISAQSKKNFVLERDVRYLDSRIALLIQNRMAADEQREVERTLEDVDPTEGHYPDDRKLQQYSNLFFLLQSEPRHIAALCRLVSLSEIDTLLQTVMFTLYGNQYESREEHLLLTMFQSVLSAQFETATDFGSLLRANTPVSRMMTTYTRRGPGQTYLKSVLAERINSLIEHKDLNLEINPVKVYEQLVNQIEEETGQLPPNLPRGVPPEVAAENPDVQAFIAPRLTMLMEIANSFLLTIIDSMESVPYGIRWICKQIRSLTRRKYPDATDYAICSLIGGFFFLRFINPAIVTPQAYMLVDGVPAKHPRRTLTLIAKMLQNLANKPSYAKEAYMITLNPFVENNKARINQFLNNLCEVGDFYDTLEMDQYMALSKKDLVIHISLNELYNTHSLILQHIETLSPNDKQHLRILTDELGAAPAQVPRKENRSIELNLYSRWETPVQDIQSALMDSVSSSDMLYMETKSIFVQLIRSIPHAAEKRPYNLAAIAERAATTKDPTLVRKGIKVKEMLRELEELKIIEHSDGFKLMQDEVAAELVHLGNLREKVVLETKSLDAVYKTICDHNNYLRSQLEQYKAYLQNVRMNASKDKGSTTGVGVVSVGGKEKKPTKAVVLGPYRFTHAQLEKEGIIVESNVPDNRRPNIYFNITSPTPGTFIIALHYKGREKAILEMDLKIDDLLEKQKDNKHLLDLEYVQLNVPKVLGLLKKVFAKRGSHAQFFLSFPSPGDLHVMVAFVVFILSFLYTATLARRLATPLPSVSLPLQLLPRAIQPVNNVSTYSGITPLSPSSGIYYAVAEIGGLYFRLALDTGSSDLCYPLQRQSPTFKSVNNNQTLFSAAYADKTAVRGFVATETVRLAPNITVQSQALAIATDCNLTLSDQVSGILGLGFPRLSGISVSNSTPFFPTLAQQGVLEYPLFGLSLAGSENGSLSLGAIDSHIVTNVSRIGWNPVVEFSPLGTESNTSSYLHWAIPMGQFAINTTRLTPIPTYPKNTGNTSLALFDVGASGIFGPYQDVSRIFASIDGSRLVNEGLWAVPCDTTVPLIFTFGSQEYRMDPTDYLIGPASGNPEICLSWPMAARPSGDGIDWQFGTPFMRTVYSIFSYGINTKESPHIGLYPLKNPNEHLTAANVSAYLSSMSLAVPTTLPNSLIPTPSISTPGYGFNASVAAPTGGVVSSALATSTYSAIFGERKSAIVTSLPMVSLVPTLSPVITTDAHGSVTTSTSTVRPSFILGLPNQSGARDLHATAVSHIVSILLLAGLLAL
ncbi:hypothetical protein MIND_00243000 [Mycena indigotica]|uniref:Ras-GAP domain-containing protein n=1 Tax=Mycena indigotica TaxID=2126181 RepID=A0A8H6T7F4_9AGAR|nr:uncharacterized protein MIND_00243000 [Mycena indigotica]KAF7312300.1 hypothetical protein MIND_00243000 [Mycena indigotica]